MRRGLLAGLVAAALLTPAQAAILEEFTVEDWSGLALSDDATGRLASCAIYSKYQNGVTLFFIKHADGNWTMSLVHDTWALSEASEHPARYRVDREPFVDASAVALDSDQMGIALSAEDSLIAQVRRGKLLTVVFGGKEYGFELSNSRKAMDGAAECIARHRQTMGPQVAEQGTLQQGPPGGTTAQAAAQPSPTTEDTGPADTPGGSSQASPIGERQTFGPWVVTATDDGAGKFVNCTAFGLHGDDQLIVSHRPDDIWEFGLYRTAWAGEQALDVNQTYYLWYNVDAPADGPGTIKRPVEAVEPTRIFFEVSGEEDIIARMERGRTLSLQLRGVAMQPQGLSYPLDQIGPAFAATRECTRRNVEAARKAPVAAAVPEPSTSGPEARTPPKALPPIGATRIEAFNVPGWHGAAFTDEAGAFTHCAMRAEYQNGTTVELLRTASGPLVMTLRRSDWSLQTGEWTPLQYQFKGAEPATVAAEALALDPSVIAFDLGAVPATAVGLTDTAELAVTAHGRSLTFDISDLGPGLAAIDECAERHRKTVAAPPPVPTGAPEKAANDGEPLEPAPASGPEPTAPAIPATSEPSPNQARVMP